MIGSVVVLYNPTEEEIKNINAYLDKVDYGVIVDNSVIDNKEHINSLLEENKKIIYYSEKRNLGLCKGFNIGIKILRNHGCEWAVLFDADSKLENDILALYRNAIELYSKDNVALFCPVHVFDRSKAKPYDGYKEVKWSMTSGWLVNIDIFYKQGGFFEELFVDGLDMDYCYKSKKNGYRIIECGNAYLKHNPAKTKKIKVLKRTISYGIAPPFRYFMQARQLVWCTLKYKKINPFFIYCYKWFKAIFLFNNKKQYFTAMIKGTIDGVIIYRNDRRKNRRKEIN